jgi:hypothetical protein
MRTYSLKCKSCKNVREIGYGTYLKHKNGTYGGLCKKCSSAKNTSFGKKTPWNKGTKVHSNTGRTHFKKGETPWNKGNKGYMGGSKHWNWKGGISPENKLIRQSIEYKQWRLSVFERDDYTCQGCDKRGGWLEADHIKPFSLHPELRFVLSNGRTLCKPCHKELGWELFRENNPRTYTDATKEVLTSVVRS